MEEVAEAALAASGEAVEDALREALGAEANPALGICRFLDMALGPAAGDPCPGCPVAPTALLLARVTGRVSHLAHAKGAVLVLFGPQRERGTPL